MKKQPDVTDKTRQNLVNVFCELYTQKPIDRISIAEITSKAGYNRSTFYQYFCDIYELLDFVENDVLQCMDTIFESHGKDISGIAELHGKKEIYLNALLGDYGSNRFLERIKAKTPIDKKKFDTFGGEPIMPYLIEFHLSTVLSLFRLWVRRGKDLPSDKVIDLIVRLYSGGMSAMLQFQK